MATFIKKPNGSYEAQISIKGVRDSGTFDSKAAARAWADERAAFLRAGAAAGPGHNKTVADAFARYAREVSPTKRGCRYERVRLLLFTRLELTVDGRRVGLADIQLAELDARHIAAFRDERLKTIKPASVNREMNLISHCFNTARKEWHWLAASPSKDVARPKNPLPRYRRISEDEAARICFALGYVEGAPVQSKQQRVAVAFLFAIETAMRLGEICALQRGKPGEANASFLLTPALARLGMTKNGYPRDVMLSARARALLAMLPLTGAPYFGLTTSGSGAVDPLFRKACARAEVQGLHFHDTRHEAISRLVQEKKLHIVTLAAMVGHRNLNELQTYYNPTQAELERMAEAL